MPSIHARLRYARDLPPDRKDAVMKTLYIVTAGSADATRASIPLHLAVNGSVEVGHETAVALLGDAAELLSEETAGRLEGVGVPPIRELMAKLLEHDVPVFV
jgi:predicted peroxiredoxin